MKQKSQFIKTSALLLLLYIVTTSLFSQNPVANTGTNFFVAFGRNNDIATIDSTYSIDLKKWVYNLEIILRITATAPGKVKFEFKDNPALNDSIMVSMGEIRDYKLSFKQSRAVYSGKAPSPPGTLNYKSVQVTATSPINLIAMSSSHHSVEATIVFPVSNLGKEYIHPDLNPLNISHSNGYLIVATEDNTTITQTCHVFPPLAYPNPMQKGEVYFYPYSDVGVSNPWLTRIVASKPVAFFQNGTQIQIEGHYNYTFEQIPPVDQWGTKFIVPALYNEINKQYSVFAKIIAKDNSSTDVITGTAVYTNASGNVVKTVPIKIEGSNLHYRNHDIIINTDANNCPTAVSCYVTTDKPVGVFIFNAPRKSVTDDFVQPGMAWVPPVEQRVRNVVVSPLDFYGEHVFLSMRHYFMIITPSSDKDNTTISINGGTPVPISQQPGFEWVGGVNIGGSGYSYGRYYFGISNVPLNVYLNTKALIDNPNGVLVYAYGQGSYTNYFYTVGAGARALSEKFSISGTVNGLQNNVGIDVRYTINGGNQEITQTTAGGVYTITNVPAGANVIITASAQAGYISTVAALPSTSLVESNIVGKNIIYKPNDNILVEFTKVFYCHENDEIDVLALMGYNCDRNNVIFNMVDQPKHADSIPGLNGNKNLPYIHHDYFQGKDNLKFSVKCGSSGTLDTVKLYVITIDCPDNITDNLSCVDTTENSVFDFRLRSKTRIGDGTNFSDYINEMDVPLVGDIYGDGNIKILAAVSRDPGSNATDWISDEIAIFDGKTGMFEKTIAVAPFHTGSGTRAIAKVGDSVKLFVASGGGVGENYDDTNNHVVCYDLITGVRDWISTAPYVPAPGHIAASILVADMNADGTPDVIAGNKIFNAKTGAMVLDMSTVGGLTYGDGAGFIMQMEGEYHHLPYFPAVADMANDGVLEYVAGYNIYKIHIPSDAKNAQNSSISLYKTVIESQYGNLSNVGDGATAVADLDGDGYLDVIVTRNTGNSESNGTPYIYAWNGKTGEMFGNAIDITHASGSEETTSYFGHGPSIPVIGDIDGCGKPEICVSTSHRIHAFKYNPSSKQIEEIATFETNENSGAIAMTMFDFNQNGKMNVLFHDFERLHILSLQGNTFVDLLAGREQADDCITFAQNEYPIVADVTGNGRANIVVFGSDDDLDAKFGRGYVYIFESTPEHPWSPARSVWNQWAYNAINVNKDLSIPLYQANPAIMYLDGECGLVHPYNSFLQQQTSLDESGCYVWPLPNLQWEGTQSFAFAGDSVIISGTVKNIGEIGIRAPVYVTIYKNNDIKANIVKLDSINKDINKGKTLDVSFTLNNISNHHDITKIIVGINDKNGELSYQKVCTPSEPATIYLTVVTISGTVSGLPDNTEITVHYAFNGGAWKSIKTDNNGKYTIPNVPYGSNVEIVPSIQTGYEATVFAMPSTLNVIEDVIDKNIIYESCPEVTITGKTSLCLEEKITLTGSPLGGTWECSNSSVVTVEDGKVTGVSPGTAEIWYKVTDGDCVNSSMVTITVNQFVKPAIYISPKDD
jgi:hypothetical protein